MNSFFFLCLNCCPQLRYEFRCASALRCCYSRFESTRGFSSTVCSSKRSSGEEHATAIVDDEAVASKGDG